MKLQLLIFVVVTCLFAFCGYLVGYHEGDKHAFDTMRLVACQNPDVESFQMHEIPDNGESL